MYQQKLLLISRLAFYPMHWEAFSAICEGYQVRGSVIAAPPPELPAVHRRLGWIDARTAAQASFRPDIRMVPELSKADRRDWLRQALAEIRPDIIWLQEEPNSPWTLDVLSNYARDRGPRIYSAVCENIFPRPRLWRGWRLRKRWRRLDGLLAVASASVHGIRRAGMPREIPAATLVAGGQSPPDQVEPVDLPQLKDSNAWVVGFVGRICEEKGWHVLVNALHQLPERFKLLMVGDGPQLSDLQEVLSRPSLAKRACHVPAQPKSELWRYYAAMDCVVLPSLTRPTWKEQFGGVLVDAMAMGKPIVGSDSGSIPEVVGNAGIIIPEGNVQSLVSALKQLQSYRTEAMQMGALGRQRFAHEFSIAAYARKIAGMLELPPRVNSYYERRAA